MLFIKFQLNFLYFCYLCKMTNSKISMYYLNFFPVKVKILNICFKKNHLLILSCEFYSKWTFIHSVPIFYLVSFKWPLDFVLRKLYSWGHLSLAKYLEQRSAKFLGKGPYTKYFWLCRPCNFCLKYFIL